jgi:hypothetical protein
VLVDVHPQREHVGRDECEPGARRMIDLLVQRLGQAEER